MTPLSVLPRKWRSPDHSVSGGDTFGTDIAAVAAADAEGPGEAACGDDDGR